MLAHSQHDEKQSQSSPRHTACRFEAWGWPGLSTEGLAVHWRVLSGRWFPRSPGEPLRLNGRPRARGDFAMFSSARLRLSEMKRCI